VYFRGYEISGTLCPVRLKVAHVFRARISESYFVSKSEQDARDGALDQVTLQLGEGGNKCKKRLPQRAAVRLPPEQAFSFAGIPK
jgi:hypothetical protein